MPISQGPLREALIGVSQGDLESDKCQELPAVVSLDQEVFHEDALRRGATSRADD